MSPLKRVSLPAFVLFACCSTFALNAQVRYADRVISFSSQYSVDRWSANQILGGPDTYPHYGDLSTAWAMESENNQRDYIELHFSNPQPVEAVAVYETFNPGAIDTIYVKNPLTGAWVVEWSGTAHPLANPMSRIFTVSFPRTSFNVSEVRIAINSMAVQGWNEYDAVGLMSSSTQVDLPDLVVTQVQAPFEAWTYQTIDVSWQVKNNGTRASGADEWTDRVFLSPNPELDLQSTALHEDRTNVSALNPGQSYTGTASITIPRGLSGNYYLFVYTNATQSISETDLGNNIGRCSQPILLHLSPAPDLLAAAMAAPTIAFAGDTIHATCTIKNIGHAATPEGSTWTDQFFLSQDTVLSVNNAVAVRTLLHESVLQQDGSYTFTAAIVVPQTLFGTYFLYLYTDVYDEVFENNIESNNIRRSPPLEIVRVGPELQVTAVTVPASGKSGEKMQIEWTVQNAGVGATNETSWEDKIYYSTDPVFKQNEWAELNAFTHEGVLAPNGSYHVVQSVVLPNGIEGRFYFYVQGDCNNDVFERSTPEERVLRSATPVTVALSPWPDLHMTSVKVPSMAEAGREISLSWTVANNGIAATPNVGWSDQVYASPDSIYGGNAIQLGDVPHSGVLAPGGQYTQTGSVTIPPTLAGKIYFYVFADADNVVYEHVAEPNKMGRSTSVSVSPYPRIDLSISSLAVPDTLAAGETVQVKWSVKNIGAGRTLTDTWDDAVYLSKYKVFIPDSSIALDRCEHDGTLSAGMAYNRTLDITVPEGLTGSYYVFIVADCAHVSGDSTEANNTISTAQPVLVRLVSKPDLVVTSVRMDDSVYAGQPTMVRWTVLNSGAGPARTTEWYDGVFLSTSGQFDANALKLESHNHQGPLASHASYTDSMEVSIPITLAGAHHVLVYADVRNDVSETIETNNIGNAKSMLRLAEPSDLVVTSVAAPDTVEPGDVITVSYTIHNQGVNPAKGSLTDAVYASANTTWDAADALLGTVDNYIDILPGGVQKKIVRVHCAAIGQEDFAGSVDGEVPGLLPGPYHFIVRTDIKDNIVESNDANNAYASSSVTYVRTQHLNRNTAKTLFIKKDQSKYYSFTAGAGEDILVQLNGGTQEGLNEMFVRYADLPGRGNYDYLYQNQNSLSQQLTVSTAKAGTYYILIRGNNLPADSVECSIITQTLQFHIDSVQSSTGGTGGEITVEIVGAQFKTGAFAQLRRSGWPTVTDNSHFLVSSTHFNARFSTVGMTPGTYDMVLINPNGDEAVLKNAVTLQQGDPSQLLVAFGGPNRLRINSIVPLYLSLYNPTNVNVQRALIYFKVRKEMKFWTETDQSFLSPTPTTWSAESLVDEDGNRVFSVYLYNLAPKRTKTIRLLVEPTAPGRYIFTADALVLDRVTFDSLLVVAVREGVNRRWLPPLEAASSGGLSKNVPGPKMKDCPSDDPGVCEAWNHRQRNQDLASDAQGVVTDGAEATNVMKPDAGGLYKLGKFFKSLLDYFNKYKNSSGYAGDAVASLDPNDLVGPAGYGDEHWVSASQTLQYTIHFENDPAKANAPAQIVTITMDLDSTLNANTFKLTNFGFAGMTWNDASGRSYYSQRLDCRDSLGLLVDVTGGVDVERNKVFWTFRAVDPATGSLPTDPMKGMLPVNDAMQHGEGWVSYTIKPKATSKTRDLISPRAKIIFDTNEPIGTPPLLNTIDAGIPVSSVQTLPSQSGTGPIAISWKGRDDDAGSGIRAYSIYVSKNDSAFIPWLTNATDTASFFTGVLGSRYRFFSLAADNAGNVEAIKTKAEATVLVTGIAIAENQIPTTFWLGQNFPNPFNPSTTIRFGLKEPSTVRIDIYDMLGKVVEQLNLGRKGAGVHDLSIDLSRYSTGIYFYRIDAVDMKGGRFVSIRKMVMLK
jgi:subtilase family serine protease